MEGFIPAEAIFDERAKDLVLLVKVIEERADVTPAEFDPGKLVGMTLNCHTSPRMSSRDVRDAPASTIANDR